MQQANQQGKFKPLEKQVLNTGVVIICTNIQEHKLTDEQQIDHIYYTWTETRYTQLEYMQVLEKQVSATEERLVLAEEVLNTMLIGGVK